VISVFECLALLVVVVVAAVIISGTTDARYDLDSLGASAADALLWLTQLTVLWFGRQAFRAATPRRDRRRAAQTAEADPATAQRILREVGGGRLSWMTTWFGNQWYLEADRPWYVASSRTPA
jgi:hypothetical protein